MNLTRIDIKEEFVKIAKKAGLITSNSLKFEPEATSYYIRYDDSKHIDNSIMEYDFDSPIQLKSYLNKLWEGEEELKQIVIEILMCKREEDKHLLEEVQGFNYTL